MGSEMCIRDRCGSWTRDPQSGVAFRQKSQKLVRSRFTREIKRRAHFDVTPGSCSAAQRGPAEHTTIFVFSFDATCCIALAQGGLVAILGDRVNRYRRKAGQVQNYLTDLLERLCVF